MFDRVLCWRHGCPRVLERKGGLFGACSMSWLGTMGRVVIMGSYEGITYAG